MIHTIDKIYTKIVSTLVYAMAAVSGVSLLTIIGITCLDIILRRLGHSIPGAVDIVQVLGCLAVVAALPYTTAVKGHIAVEFFFRKLPRTTKVLLDTFTRLLVIALFAILCWRSFLVGLRYLKIGTMSLTLNMPLFWVLWLMSASFAVVILVKIFNITHPGKEMIHI